MTNMITLANAFGRELFFDEYGRLVLQPIPNPLAGTIQWSYYPGSANLALSGSRIMDTTGTISNMVLVQSSGTGVPTPVSALAQITDTNSPIYPGSIGPRPLIFTTSLLTSQGQCAITAQNLLNRQLGANDNVAFSAVPHPAHEPGDVVQYVSFLTGNYNPVTETGETNVVLCLSAWQLACDLLQPNNYTTRLVSSTVGFGAQDADYGIGVSSLGEEPG